MFIQRLLHLCELRKTDISNVLRDLGLSTSKGTAWRNGSVPNGEILLLLANYFHVSVDYLLGNTDDPTPAGGEKPAPVTGAGFKPTMEDWERIIDNMSKEEIQVVIELLMKKYLEK